MVHEEHACMEDFNGLASSLAAGVSDVRGCLILSRDGLVVGSHPADGEAQAKPAWVRFAALGDPERGFAQFGTETWCYVRRGPYAAFAVVGPGARPGLVIDHMEQVLLAAEEARNSRAAVRAEPAPPAAPSGKPRTQLHPERPVEEPVVITADVGSAAAQRAAPPAAVPAVSEAPPAADAPPEPPAPPPVAPADEPEPAPAAPEPTADSGDERPEPTPDGAPEGPSLGSAWDVDDGEDDVDRFSLAREFGQLLQEDDDGADG
jgi:hypothetical protein